MNSQAQSKSTQGSHIHICDWGAGKREREGEMWTAGNAISSEV